MMPTLLRRFVAGFACLLGAAALQAAEPPIVAKARAYLGTEAALNAVKSVHYAGTLVITEEDGKTVGRATVDLVFQSPQRQRVEAIYEKRPDRVSFRETTALDDSEGWQVLQEVDDLSRWQFKVFDAAELKVLRARTWENLTFYRGIEERGGRIEDMGDVTTEGVKCRKVAFIYSPAAIFYRHFDVNTGRLVFTETADGSALKEEGEILVDGIRFSKRIVQRSRDTDGKIKILTTTFDKITLNEEFPASFFAMPSVPSPRLKPTALGK